MATTGVPDAKIGEVKFNQRRIGVTTISTSSPPIAGQAIGYQIPVSAIGIRPRPVHIAVSTISRKRDIAITITAIPTFGPIAF